MMMTLYRFPVSPFAEKAARALGYKGLAWREVHVRQSEREANLVVSPTHKFPVLELEDGTRITDSTDIGYWLERAFPDKPIIPADPRDRAMMHVIEDWADDALFYYDLYIRIWPQNIAWLFRDVFGHEPDGVRHAMEEMVPGAVRKMLEGMGLARKSDEQVLMEMQRHVDAVDGLLAGGRDWLVGGHLTIADIGLFSMFYMLDRTVEVKAMVDDRPAVRAWVSRVDGACPLNIIGEPKVGMAA